MTDSLGRFYFRYPNGESRADVTQRTAIFIGKMLRTHYSHHIVFLHGVGSDKSVWRPQLDYFAVSRHAVALDYPGYGESDPADSEADHDAFAMSILAALDVLGIESAHICGLSLGGVVAIALHHAAPDRCASLILADSSPRIPTDAESSIVRSSAGR
jgi:pimeloyl-ACP methyl ester carboxylesterase